MDNYKVTVFQPKYKFFSKSVDYIANDLERYLNEFGNMEWILISCSGPFAGPFTCVWKKK